MNHMPVPTNIDTTDNHEDPPGELVEASTSPENTAPQFNLADFARRQVQRTQALLQMNDEMKKELDMLKEKVQAISEGKALPQGDGVQQTGSSGTDKALGILQVLTPLIQPFMNNLANMTTVAMAEKDEPRSRGHYYEDEVDEMTDAEIGRYYRMLHEKQKRERDPRRERKTSSSLLPRDF